MKPNPILYPGPTGAPVRVWIMTKDGLHYIETGKYKRIDKQLSAKREEGQDEQDN